VNTALVIAIPTFAVLLGIIFNRQESTALRAEMGSLRVEMIALRDSIHRDMFSLHERVATVEAKLSR
jgi:hypothetical protein